MVYFILKCKDDRSGVMRLNFGGFRLSKAQWRHSELFVNYLCYYMSLYAHHALYSMLESAFPYLSLMFLLP